MVSRVKISTQTLSAIKSPLWAIASVCAFGFGFTGFGWFFAVLTAINMFVAIE